MSQPWSHPVVLNMGLLDWESSALTTVVKRLMITEYSVLYENSKPRRESQITTCQVEPCIYIYITYITQWSKLL